MRRLAVAALCLAILAGAGGAAADATFPPGTPAWIQRDVLAIAKGLGYPAPDSIDVTLGRFPRVVLTGAFTCARCTGPKDSAPATGTVVALRFDAKTRRSTDFGLCGDADACLGSLCSGDRCTRATDALDSAFDELSARHPTASEPFDHRVGHSRCHIRIPVRAYKWVRGSCTVSLTTAASRTLVVFTETWRGKARDGHRFPDGPLRHHLWRITENRAGWVQRVVSGGDWPLQWPR